MDEQRQKRKHASGGNNETTPLQEEGGLPQKLARKHRHPILYEVAIGGSYHDTTTFSVDWDGKTMSKAQYDKEVPAAHVKDVLALLKNMADGPSILQQDVCIVYPEDTLPVRHCLLFKPRQTTVHVSVLDPRHILWFFPRSHFKDETRQNWLPVSWRNVLPLKGRVLCVCRPGLWCQNLVPKNGTRPGEFYTRLKRFANVYANGQFLVDLDELLPKYKEFLAFLINSEMVGVVQDMSHLVWSPPVRISTVFGRTITCSHDYVSENADARIRIQLHASLFEPQSYHPHIKLGHFCKESEPVEDVTHWDVTHSKDAEAPEVVDDDPPASEFETGVAASITVAVDQALQDAAERDEWEVETEDGSDGDDASFDSADEPRTRVAADEVAVFFGSRDWIVEGSRSSLDEFCSHYFGVSSVKTLVDSGHVQYLIPKVCPGYTFF